MKRKLLTYTFTLPFLALALTSACLEDTPATNNTGGAGTTGGSAGAGTTGGSSGATSGGSSASGSTSGGSSGAGTVGGGGSGGAATGGGGSGGAATGGGGSTSGPPSIDEFAGMKNQHGFAWKDSYFLVPCTSVSGHDCLTVPGNCPNQGAQNFEEKGSTFTEEFQVGGDPTKTYAVTIKVNGVVEGKYYNGGMRRDGDNYADANDPMGGDGWHVGGSPQETSYNVFKITVLKPDGMELQHYYLNSFPQSSGFESHQTVLIGYEATIDVPGGGKIRYLNQDSNCRAINNCGAGDITNKGCPAARMVPNEPGLAVPATYGSKPVDGSFNQVNQAQQPFHAQMVHVTVTKVELKP